MRISRSSGSACGSGPQSASADAVRQATIASRFPASIAETKVFNVSPGVSHRASTDRLDGGSSSDGNTGRPVLGTTNLIGLAGATSDVVVTALWYPRQVECRHMASLIEAIEIKRKMFFEFEGAPYHCIDVEISRPTSAVCSIYSTVADIVRRNRYAQMPRR